MKYFNFILIYYNITSNFVFKNVCKTSVNCWVLLYKTWGKQSVLLYKTWGKQLVLLYKTWGKRQGLVDKA